MKRLRSNIKIVECLQSRKGFTFPEVLVTLLIFTFIAAAINSTLLAGNASWQTNSVEVELQQNLRQAMQWMKNDLQQTGQSAIVDVPANGSWYTSINFQKAIGVKNAVTKWDEDNNVPPNDIFTQFILGGANSNQLLKNVVIDDDDDDTNTTRVIAQNIQSLQFQRVSTDLDIINIALQAQKKTLAGAQGRTITLTLDFKIRLRN